MATLIENVNRIYTDKEAIKQAITEKGVAVPDGTSLDEYANLIAQINAGIDTSAVTATASDVLAGKVIVDADGNKVAGTMNDYSKTDIPTNGVTAAITSLNKGSFSNSIGSGRTLSFHPNFSGYVTPDTTINQNVYGLNPAIVKSGELIGGNGSPADGALRGTYTSDATATAATILKDKTAYVNGVKVTGSIASKAAAIYTPSTANQTIAAGQYLSGAQTIKGDANLTAANIISGKSIFGVNGTAAIAQSYSYKFNIGSNGYYSYKSNESDDSTVFKNNTWQKLGYPFGFTYQHNLNLPAKDIIVCGKISCGFGTDNYDGHPFRFSRGYAASSTTAQYWYMPYIPFGGKFNYHSSYNGWDSGNNRLTIDASSTNANGGDSWSFNDTSVYLSCHQNSIYISIYGFKGTATSEDDPYVQHIYVRETPNEMTCELFIAICC